MKTKFLTLIIFLFFIGGFTPLEAQGLYNLATLDDEFETVNEANDKDIYNDYFTYGGYLKRSRFRKGAEWADHTLGGSAGFGWNDNDGDSETSYCAGVEYLYRITGDKQNPKGAGYLGAFATYHAGNSDSFDESLLRAGAKYTYFDPITAFNQVQLIYGINAFYETGSRDFSGFKDDVSGYGSTLYTGVNVRIGERASIGLEIPVASFVSRTFKSNGNEFEQDRFSLGVNKNNSVSATLRWVLDELDKIDSED